MIDIHSHIIFDVDDGPLTIDESLSLLEESYMQGVRTIVSTSHRRMGIVLNKVEETLDSYGGYGAYASYGKSAKKKSRKRR